MHPGPAAGVARVDVLRFDPPAPGDVLGFPGLGEVVQKLVAEWTPVVGHD